MSWQKWIRTVEIEPALDAAQAASLERPVEALLRTGCRVFHLNGSPDDAIAALDLLAPLVHRYDGVLDVHLPGGFDDAVARAGADSVTFDAAAVDDVAAAIRDAHAASVEVGVAFAADVPAGEAAASAGDADLVLYACAGQGDVEHVRLLSGLLPEEVAIQVEGAVSFDNVRSLYLAGAKLLVADDAIFVREDLPRAYRRLVQALA